MGVSDKLSKLSMQFQSGIKYSTIGFFAFFMKLLTGFTLGLTFALVGQQVFNYATGIFIFVLIVVMGLTFKLIAKWNLGAVVLFDLFCVLVALLLRMYILLAP